VGDKWTVKNESSKKFFLEFVNKMDFTKPYEFTWKLAKSKRSNDANGLYWMWMTELAKHFSNDAGSYTKDEMHDLMRHKFLGYETKVIGNTELQPQLKSTAKLNTSEFCDYMMKVDVWAQSCSVLLPRPENNLYTQYYEEVG
jgi:hypothetical protein